MLRAGRGSPGDEKSPVKVARATLFLLWGIVRFLDDTNGLSSDRLERLWSNDLSLLPGAAQPATSPKLYISSKSPPISCLSHIPETTTPEMGVFL